MVNTVKEKLELLRSKMKEHSVDAYIIPTADPHLSEYPAKYWETRKWISGFTGSAGTVVVFLDSAGLWTDSRYFLQAEEELRGSGIQLFKKGTKDCPDMIQYLGDFLEENAIIGVDGKTISISEIESLKQTLKYKGLKIVTDQNYFESIWSNRPPLPLDLVFEMPVAYSGLSRIDKISLINSMISSCGADATVLSALDDVAWTFNLRGTDVEYNPVVIAYAYISLKEKILFVDIRKIPKELSDQMVKEGIIIASYEMFYSYLKRIDKDTKILLDPSSTNEAIRTAIPSSCSFVEGRSPANTLKSIKNETEIKGFKKAVVKDGIATAKYFYWLESEVKKGKKITELEASRKLTDLRSQQDGYIMDSFETISSYGSHGAIVHYSPSLETDIPIGEDSLYLVDSGGQYFDGTTDITRTIIIGDKATSQMKKDFTCVLKGTIGLASSVFPLGTRGCLIDFAARRSLWKEGLQYGHGTGHGIGHCLNVHEGPQSIRMEENPVVLESGMVLSDEPGIYREGKYGIRIENMICVSRDQETEYGVFLKFETLTLCYIEQKLIDINLLSLEEKEWLNNYHQKVYNELKDFLTIEEQEWLKNKTKRITV